MANPIGEVLAQDEQFCHQVIDTFAVTGSTDLAWTEKVCAMAAARDGSLQLGFGLGKYTNRNVMDGYAGLSRGVEQVTVRASRRLSPEPNLMTIGPIRYEVIEPLKVVRFSLDANDCQPIAFDWTFEAVVPPFVEERTHQRAGYRVSAELARYHQSGVASGWLEVDGERTEITPDTWVSTRDHSWGVRYDVGQPVADVERVNRGTDASFSMIWCPVVMERPDGSRYALMLHYTHLQGPGYLQKMVTGGIEHPDGRFERWVDLVPELSYDPENRRLRGGRVHATTEDGVSRTLEFDVPTETGFHLGAGLYFGFDGHYHGEWRGPLHVDGERIEDCSTVEQARRLHQIRDTVVHVVDQTGGAEGWGNCQPVVAGAHPELGLVEPEFFL